MENRIREIINESINAKKKLIDECSEPVIRAYKILYETLNNDGKLLIFGNGGSAADSQHFASEIVGRCSLDSPAKPAIALTADPMFITAAANDFGFDQIFARQIIAYGKPGDLAIGISTSGNSLNVLEAFKVARELGLKTIAILGKDGGMAKDLVDIPLIVPSNSTPRIQEMHITVIHAWCQMLEEGFKPVD